MIFPPDHNVFALFNAKMAIVTHGNPFNERCRKRHCRPMGHYLVFCCCTSNENSRGKIRKTGMTRLTGTSTNVTEKLRRDENVCANVFGKVLLRFESQAE